MTKKSFQEAFWRREPIEPIPLLGDLRTFVLERSHSRMPQWRFRLADDFVLYVQSKPGERRDRFFAFVCKAFAPEQLGQRLTRQLCDEGTDVWRLHFGIDLEWRVKPTYFQWPAGRDRVDLGADFRARAARRELNLVRLIAFRARIVETLRSGAFDHLDARMMLSPHCLCCGRELTDPVSIARWIGPECAHESGSPRRTWNLGPQQADLPLRSEPSA